MGSRFDTVFRVSIILKGIDALIEIIGGVILLFVTSKDITHFTAWLTRSTLASNPHNAVATYLNHSAGHLAADSTLIGAIYLLSHGVIKLFIIINVLRDKYWAYPVLIVVLLGFCVYQVVDIINNHSLAVTLLTVFDVFVIILTWLEWQKKRKMRISKTAKEETQITH
jgi:uncharacterized membrane protein